MTGFHGLRRLPTLAAASGLAALIAAPSMAATAAPAPLTVVNGPMTHPKGVFNSSYGYGTTVQGMTTIIQHDFVVKNTTNAPIDIDHVDAQCNCSTLRLMGLGPGNVVAAGKTFNVRMTLITDLLPDTRSDKFGWVFIHGRKEAALTLHMVGTIRPSLSYDPAIIDFHTVPVDQTRTLTMRVTYDTRVFGKNPPDAQVGGDRCISLERSTSHLDTAHNKLVRTYQVKLDPRGHLGRFDSGVFVPVDPRKADRDGGSVLVMGTIAGSIVSSPPAVAFGTVNRGQTVTKEFVLKGLSPTALAGLSLSSDTSDLKPTLVSKEANKAVVEVSVSPSTPGAMLSNVIVATKNGQVLKVLVSAWVN